MNNLTYTKIANYIDHNPIAVLGTINPDGTPHGATIYLCSDDEAQPIVYFITKNETQKYKNLLDRPAACITIVNTAENSTLQASGRAFNVHDARVIDMVSKKIARAHRPSEGWLPPIAKLRAGAYVMIGIELQKARLAEYSGAKIGDEKIFTQA